MRTIRQYREQRGWSRKTLAEKIGHSAQSVYYWEAGQKVPSATALKEMARLFGVSMDDIEFVEYPEGKAVA